LIQLRCFAQVLRALVPSVGFVFLSMTSASFANKSISGKSQLLTPTLGRSSGGSRTTATLPPAKLHLVPWVLTIFWHGETMS
jgi:hypothetical protein